MQVSGVRGTLLGSLAAKGRVLKKGLLIFSDAGCQSASVVFVVKSSSARQTTTATSLPPRRC